MANGHRTQVIEDERTIGAVVPGRPKSLWTLPVFVQRSVVLLSKAVARTGLKTWAMIDITIAIGALAAGYGLTPAAKSMAPPLPGLFVFAASCVTGGFVIGLYERDVLQGKVRLFSTAFVTIVIGVIALALFSNLILYKQIGRWVLIITFCTAFTGSVLARLIGHFAARLYKVRVLLIGDTPTISAVAERLAVENGHHRLIGYCGDCSNPEGQANGSIGDIPCLCREMNIDEVVISEGYMNRADVLDQCFRALSSGCRVLDEASFYEELFEEVPVRHINEGWFFTAKLGGTNPFHAGLKRLVDIVAAAAGILLTAPIFLVLWVLIRMTSRGPAIYSQERCGRYGKTFRIYKLRSMVENAEPDGPQWAGRGDPRITPLGRFLRKTRFDEIPQFWNVLKGDMSFVGPRPERPEMVEDIEKAVPYFAFRHLTRPGITGLAQVRFQYGANLEDARRKLQYDLFYIKNWSILLDIQIILRTFSAIMKGAR